MDSCRRAYPDIFFLDKRLLSVDYERRDEYEMYGARTIPIRWADTNARVPYRECMLEKYRSYGLDYNIWKEQAMWHRDTLQEDRLFKHLGLEEGQEYTLVNRFFGTQSQLVAQIPRQGIEMCTIEGYSLFDWCKIIECAKEVHTVSTSVLFILECLDLGDKPIHVYPRIPIERDFKNVDYLLTPNKYILHA